MILQGGCDHPLGTELRQLCELFRSNSSVATSPLGQLLLFASSYSCVQATMPFAVIPALTHLCNANADNWVVHYTDEVRELLFSSSGQPVVGVILDDLVLQSRSADPPLDDIRAVLTFINYLCENVKRSVTDLAMLARILFQVANGEFDVNPSCDRPPAHDWPPAKAIYNPDFCIGGIYYPGFIQHQERGKYKKDSDKSKTSKTPGVTSNDDNDDNYDISILT
jgi:hypothetical protein